ncbi:MAG TPA: HAMP domain-containing sensor histidine kinase [Gaiellaceae bacterium]
MVKDLLRWRRRQPANNEGAQLRLEAARARILVEESDAVTAILDESGLVVAAGRRAREVFPGLEIGKEAPEEMLRPPLGALPVLVPYEVDGRREVLLRLVQQDLSAYDELRSGFTAVVSHELRTPLARLLALLETALLPGTDQHLLVDQARREVEQIRELIDEVLFLSELETGREVVSLGGTRALPILRQVLDGLRDTASRAGIRVRAEGDDELEVPLRPRMLRVVAENLAENAIRYAGQGATFTLSVERVGDRAVLRARDDGTGVPEPELGRLFERFYRADRARASRGTGLGLAIVKHIVTSAGGTIQASGAPGEGLEIRASFPLA